MDPRWPCRDTTRPWLLALACAPRSIPAGLHSYSCTRPDPWRYNQHIPVQDWKDLGRGKGWRHFPIKLQLGQTGKKWDHRQNPGWLKYICSTTNFKNGFWMKSDNLSKLPATEGKVWKHLLQHRPRAAQPHHASPSQPPLGTSSTQLLPRAIASEGYSQEDFVFAQRWGKCYKCFSMSSWNGIHLRSAYFLSWSFGELYGNLILPMTPGSVKHIHILFRVDHRVCRGPRKSSRLPGVREFSQILGQSQRESSGSWNAKLVQSFELLPDHEP